MLAERTSASLPDHQQPWWPSRYGAEDQIGSLNEITPAQIVAAARLVRQGRVFDRGRVLDSNVPHFPGRFWQQTLVSNAHLRSGVRGRGSGISAPETTGRSAGGESVIGPPVAYVGEYTRLDQAPNESARPMDERVTPVLLPKTVHQQRISGDTLMGEQSTSTSDGSPRGSLDGSGAGDHDELFSGFHAYQFSTRQLARLYLLRGELLDARLGQGRWVMDLAPGAS